jgi:hypothetical protein
MINALGEEIADQSGLPISVELDRVSRIVEQSEQFGWAASRRFPKFFFYGDVTNDCD